MMFGRLAALILLCRLSRTSDVSRQIPLTLANLGGNVTVSCPESVDKTGLFYIYKMQFGYMAETVAVESFNKFILTGKFNTPRFSVTKNNGLNSLTIMDISKEDEAMYFCQAGGVYAIEFTDGIVLMVKDEPNQQKSVRVEQTPKTQSGQLGELMTVQCSLLSENEENEECPDGHSVYWFRTGSGKSHPSVLYTHGHRSEEAQNTSCVYRLSRTIQESDNETFYCAVNLCGEILFGEGTKVQPQQDHFPFYIGIGTLLFCFAIVMLVMVLKQVCHCCGGGVASQGDGKCRSNEDQPTVVEAETEVNYSALDFHSRSGREMGEPRPGCIYSGPTGCQ